MQVITVFVIALLHFAGFVRIFRFIIVVVIVAVAIRAKQGNQRMNKSSRSAALKLLQLR